MRAHAKKNFIHRMLFDDNIY